MRRTDDIQNLSDWEGTLEIPSIDAALELLISVRDHQDKESYETVLLIYKLAKKPITEEELLSLTIICEAYRLGNIIFR